MTRAASGDRPLWNGRFDAVRPRAVVRCATTQDVAAALREPWPVAVRAGGHGFGGHATSEGVVIDVGPMDAVEVAPGAVRVGAGARLWDVHRALDPHGLTLPGGTCPPVGVAGLALGGGLGILGRLHGVLSDRLTAAEVVLADGRVVACDADRHPDLLWALRGAGAGTFGVVTQLTFAPVRAPERAVNVHAAWPVEQAARLIDAWQRWAPDRPPELAASLKVTVPADREQPARVDLHAVLFGTTADADRSLRGMLADPGIAPTDTTTTATDYRGTRAIWANLGGPGSTEEDALEVTERARVFATSSFFHRLLGGDDLDALLAATLHDRVDGEVRELDFMPWGGAYASRPSDESAFVHRGDRCLLKLSTAVALDASPAAATAAGARLATMHHALRATATGRAFQNFAGPSAGRWSPAYFGANLPRLLAVKARYDPDDRFTNHP